MPEATLTAFDSVSSEATLPLRFVTAASLFDGHDAAINIMRRIMQEQGAEIIHLGHNRGVEEVVRAALQEDVDGISISSYQGGHVEYFKYMIDLLRQAGAEHIRVFGGGGGVIVPEEIRELEGYGVEKVYSPEDGRVLGLEGMITDLIERTAKAARGRRRAPFQPGLDTPRALGEALTELEVASGNPGALAAMRRIWRKAAPARRPPVIGLTGPGGAGKSSLTDELLNRFLQGFPDLSIAVLAVDPTKRRTGGALLGDRIRMNALVSPRIYMRSMATHQQNLATNQVLADSIDFLACQGFGLILVETAGIGQSDSSITDLVDLSVYIMTSEYGAATQLEKIDMLDFADIVVLNKFEKRGAEDALRDVKKQWRRNRKAFALADEEVPVYPSIASQFNDPGTNRLFINLCRHLVKKLALDEATWAPQIELAGGAKPSAPALIPGPRQRYLAEIAEQGRSLNRAVPQQAEAATLAQSLYRSLEILADEQLPAGLERYPQNSLTEAGVELAVLTLRQRYNSALGALTEESLQLLRQWPERRDEVTAEQYSYRVRDREIRGDNYVETLSHLRVPKVAAPRYQDWGEILSFLLRENLPGHYPYTASVFPYRRTGEDPARMFAGEGTPERTNRRFHYVSLGQPANRLSTAFDSVTLYGEDPDERPDIYGKIGNSGVSIATLDDMKKLYSGFNLCDPGTSVSMTINGPAPMILAFYINAAVDQQIELHLRETGRWQAAEQQINQLLEGKPRPRYQGELPEGNEGLGLGLLGVSGDQLVDGESYGRIRAETLSRIRGTVQADILKEDQAQNTCIFSTEFALRMMGDIQSYFIANRVHNYYSVSISGYHIAEAGANPISQLAFTLSNGFTIVEYYLARGMRVDDFAPNLSFFFSNGMDPEYAVMGRVARRIWARAMRARYGANERSQKLKYHIQTSGRSLHAQEIQFNDIRTTLQALYAIYDNCNSLHTNAYDEAITTPTEESVRRAMAIQLIINRELGLNVNENPLQGAFVIDELTDLVEEAVYAEFERISDRGGVLGAMETMYQRGKIQDESLYYEGKKHDGSLPIIGVNTFLPKETPDQDETTIDLIRSTEQEKQSQIAAVEAFHVAHQGGLEQALTELQQTARSGGNIFETLLESVKHASLGQLSGALYQVGGQYRRNM
ncbi:MAG: methylmalonyl-CoA mutase family protein [Gammaproteobacteria bacterium]|nr:methylmalonyl-CoA mutase family protein [Gammaproteobacteria bacterium]